MYGQIEMRRGQLVILNPFDFISSVKHKVNCRRMLTQLIPYNES